jgi:enediyne biosynthesis protein E4
MTIRYIALLLALVLLACNKTAETNQSTQTNASEKPTGPPIRRTALFTLLSPDQTGVTFSNNLTEGLNTNVLMYEYFYNGGGVAIGDLNNDGLDDIYFTGNMVPNQLYLNKGKMQFSDVTAAAGVAGREGPWKTGVAMADVNGDGRLDLYVCHSGALRPEGRTPELFINDGPDAQGTPHFTDRTADYGLANPAQTTQAAFFDYDRDGDLDLFQLNHNPRLLPILDPTATANLMKEPNKEIGVRLYKNTKNRFTDITEQMGLSSSVLTYGLGVGISDLNNDGWPDLYLSNDYGVPDYLYLNKQNGRGFTNVLARSVGHTSNFSMGNAVADVNNDALPDILTLDMLPEDNRRQKLLMAPDNYEKYDLALQSGFHHQIMRNMLHLNEGTAPPAPVGGAVPHFREVGQLAGIANTDWSWSPLLADYDNDGWKDLYITNGYVRDYTNLDFLKYMNDFMQNRPTNPSREDVLKLVHQMPASNVSNYLFQNQGTTDEVLFTNVGAAWGLTQTSNSTGAAYADLDNDGDLDLVVNNTNQSAFVYQNEANRSDGPSERKHHYLAISLKGNTPNTQGLGAKVMVYQQGRVQLLEQMPTQGYQSSVSPRLHVGLGANATIDSVRVVWLTGKQQLLKQPKADQLLTLSEKDANGVYRPARPEKPLFREQPATLAHTYPSPPINDFKRQPLLVNAQSFVGPCLVKGDVNGDGREDVYAGGSMGQAGVLFVQQANGSFKKQAQPAFEADKACEDADAVFFDANGDRFPDLYVCSGGYGDLQPDTDPQLQDRLYLNDGKGNFTKATANALPNLRTATSCVRVADVNADGRPDLFVGGRVVPGRYPEAPRSYLLINTSKGQGGMPSFVDQTKQLAPALERIGMVTDAAWIDLTETAGVRPSDRPELVLVGEWMPVTVMAWKDGKLTNQTEKFLGKSYAGWWNRLLIDDLNADGRPDLVVGNQGLNTQCRATDREPAELVYKDFDNNGKLDPVLCLYVQGRSYPHATRDELLDQLTMLRPRFTTYESYANATLTDVFKPEELEGSSKLTANELRTMVFLSSPGGKYTAKPLPMAAQTAPIFAITALDADKDGLKDLLLCGNTLQTRIRFGRADANRGLLLRGDGKGNFAPVSQTRSGFALAGDVRSTVQVGNKLLIGVNRQGVRVYGL